jgi:hypothetical protein
MLLDSDFENLPDDDNLAFAKLEGSARIRADSVIELANQSECGDIIRPMQDYMAFIKGLADEYNIPGLANWSPSSDTENSISAHYHEFRSDAIRAAMQSMVRGRSRTKQNTVKLDAAAKEKIRFHINQIREMVNASDLTEITKRSLHLRLSSLELEIDQARTRIEFISSLAMTMADYGFDCAKKVAQVTAIFSKARKTEQEEVALPVPEQRKQIEAPQEGESMRNGGIAGNKFGSDFDEEIPF